MRNIALLAAAFSLIATASLAGPQDGSNYSATGPSTGPKGGSTTGMETTAPSSSPIKDFKFGGGAEVDSRWVGSAGHLVSKDPHFVPWAWIEHDSGAYFRETWFVNIPETKFREADHEIGWNIKIPDTGITLTPSATYFMRSEGSDEWGLSLYGEKAGFFVGGDYYSGFEKNWNDAWFLRAGYSQTFNLDHLSLTPKGMISYGGAVDFDKATIGELSIQASHASIPWAFVGVRGTFPISVPERDERETQVLGFIGAKF